MTTVPPRLDGERADKIVADLAGVSRSAARRLVDAGEVTADGEPVAAKERLMAGAVLVIPEIPPAPVLMPQEAPLTVLHEDEHLVVIDKSPGMVVHPGAGDTGVTLAAALLHRWPQVRGVGDEDRWGIVHRLDRDTSGAMVVALSHEAFSGLKTQFGRREVGRRYVALLDGTLEVPSVTVDAPIGRDPRRPRRMAVVTDGRRAVTHFTEERRIGDRTLVSAQLETGRTHQIRVHAASLGTPVVGDGLYGRLAPDVVERMFLHAGTIEFRHPVTDEQIVVTAPLPPDLDEALSQLG